jgi:hypothetical protein
MNSFAEKKSFQSILSVLAVFGALTLVYFGVSILNRMITSTAHAQQDPFLDRRISQIEQRFTFIENRINRLEQSSRVPTITPSVSSGDESESRLLRAEIETLRLRLAEAECALVKLDERTLSAEERQARKKTGGDDRCRLNSGTALRLSARP